jgi:predicted DNA-binding transcriptional regulator AlpA
VSDRRVIDMTTDELRALIISTVEKAVAQLAPVTVDDDREIGMPELLKLLDVKRPETIWRWRRTEGFPAPRKFGKGRVRWLLSAVNAWRASRETSGPGETPAPAAKRRRTDDRGATAPH